MKYPGDETAYTYLHSGQFVLRSSTYCLNLLYILNIVNSKYLAFLPSFLDLVDHMWMPAAGSHNLRFASFWVLVCGFWLLLGRAKTASIGDFSSFSRPIIASFWSLMISTNPHNLRHFIRPAVSFGLRLFAFWLHSCVSGCPGCTHVDACGRLPYARARSRSYARGRFLAGVRAYVFATHMRLHLAVTSHALVFASCSCSPVWKSASEARYPRFFLDFIVRGESRRLSDARPCALYARVR